MDLFPYKYRKNQNEIVTTIGNSLIDRKHFVFESGTGSGKTICALSSTLNYALEHNKKIVYAKLNPKNLAIDVATKLGLM